MWDNTFLHVDRDGMVGAGVKFERIRRITGYLVGTLDRFNNAKKAEERERLKHGGVAWQGLQKSGGKRPGPNTKCAA